MWIKGNLNRIPVLIFLFVIMKIEGRALNTTPAAGILNIESNSIQRLIVESQTESDPSRSLKRVFLSNRTVTCNDGSQAGFYLRKSSGSKKWIVFLEGGWHCYDLKSCRARWLRLRHLMTSAQWPETRDVGGILSPLSDDNPYWYNANHVLVPYCSSDSWSGTKSKPESSDSWRFMGSLIIRQVISDLIPLGLGRSPGSELLLAGSSAGGLGVMLNLDKIRSFLHGEKKLKVAVRGVSDSGWFLDREPYTPGAIAASEAVRQGWKLWDGALPQSCVKQHLVEPWRCYFGHRLYSTLKSPLFVFQWLFDEAQMRADSVGAPVTPQQWNYIHDMGGALRESLDNVTAVFAPSCIGHSVLTKRDWLNVKIDEITLSEALRCWERSTSRKSNKLRRGLNKKKQKRQNPNKDIIDIQENHNNNNNNNNKTLTKEEKEQRRRHNERKRNHRRSRTTQNPQDLSKVVTTIISDNTTTLSTVEPRVHHRRRKNLRQNNRNKKRRKMEQNNGRHHHNHQQQQRDQQSDESKSKTKQNLQITEPKRCSLRLLERCSWPQCNHSCPTLTNPMTGEEMRFLELLASFGLDIEAVAAALGVDMQTLNNMDHTELVNLLTQQVN